MLPIVCQKSKSLPPLQGNSVQTLTTEAAPSTPTNEETELSSCLAGQVSESTQTEENASALCSVPWRKRRIA